MFKRLIQGSHVVLKVLNCKISFQDLEKVFEFVQSVHKVLKKCENSKFNHLFIKICHLSAFTSEVHVTKMVNIL